MKEKALQICEAIVEAGGTPLLAGGCVRDILLGITPRDYDIECFGLDFYELEDVLVKFGKVEMVGKQYGVYKIDGVDISIPRCDEEGEAHKDVKCEFDICMPIEKAAKRRDLTMNAMYYNPVSKVIIDPLGGMLDLTVHKIIKASSLLTFNKDPLRPLRAARFKALFPQLNLGEATVGACKEAPHEAIRTLPRDRVFGELVKVLMEAPVPSVFFASLEAMKLLDVVFPELAALKKVEQGPKHHPEGNAYTHTMMALDILPLGGRDLSVMLAILFHDLGKLVVPAEVIPEAGHVKFVGHAEATELAVVALGRLTGDKQLIESVLSLIAFHMHPYNFRQSLTKKAVRKLASQVDMPKLMKLHEADTLGRGWVLHDVREDRMKLPRAIMEVYEQIVGEIKPILQGRDLMELGAKPGKHFGPVLKELYEAQMEEAFTNHAEGMAYFKAQNKYDYLWREFY